MLFKATAWIVHLIRHRTENTNFRIPTIVFSFSCLKVASWTGDFLFNFVNSFVHGINCILHQLALIENMVKSHIWQMSTAVCKTAMGSAVHNIADCHTRYLTIPTCRSNSIVVPVVYTFEIETFNHRSACSTSVIVYRDDPHSSWWCLIYSNELFLNLKLLLTHLRQTITYSSLMFSADLQQSVVHVHVDHTKTSLTLHVSRVYHLGFVCLSCNEFSQ